MNRGTKSSSRSAHVALTVPPRNVAAEVADPAEHRRKLEALFGGVPAQPREVAAPVVRNFATPARRLGRGRMSDRSLLLNLTRESMREAIANNDREAFERGAQKFLTAHELPDDADFLCKMLHHPSDRVVCNVLGHISALLLQKRLMASLPLVEMAVAEVGRRKDTEGPVHCCVQGLLAQISRLRAPPVALQN